MKTLFLSLVLAVAPGSELTWHRVVGLLQYLEGDYPAAVASGDAAELNEQRGFADEVVQALPAQSPFRARAEAIAAAIDEHRSASEVSAACRALSAEIISSEHLVQAPKETPDLAAGAKVFQATCASCHGEKGDGQSAIAAAMNPKPANFHNAERMSTITPYKVFNTTTFGISGTLMPAFPQLSDSQRWSLAFYIFTLRHPVCVAGAQPGTATLSQLATSTDQELTKAFGPERLACLRGVMPVIDEHSSLNVAIAGVRHAIELSAQGQHDQARQAIVDAYLNGVEPVEPLLRSRDATIVSEIERSVAAARLVAQRGGDLQPQGQVLLSVLERASNQRTAGDFWSVFITALLIILREGFEAAVVVGALLAVLKKMGATEQSRVVHLGWILALVFGGIAYVFGQQLLAGANREWMETVVSLLAVGMLVYAALWLNARANMSKFMGELREKMKDAVGSGNLLGLFLISFTSVGRETVETALFLEGLAGDSPAGAGWGALAGLVVLLGFLLFVRRVGFVLPMKTLFKASTVLLVATAVILIGRGFHGLQELGVLPLAPARFITIEALGLFADWVSLVPQLLLTAAPLIWWLGKRPKLARRLAPHSS